MDYRDKKKPKPDARFVGDAIHYIEKTLTLYPPGKDIAVFHYYLGLAYLEKGQEEKARKQLRLAFKLNPDFNQAGAGLAWQGNKTGQAPDVDTQPPPPSYQLGMEYLMNKNYAQAIAQFEEASDESPGSLITLINLGVAYRASGQTEKAITVYERALKLKPESLPAQYNLAMALLSQNRPKEAMPILKNIVRLLPQYQFAQFHLAGAYEKIGLKKKAIKEYGKFIRWAASEPKMQPLVKQAEEMTAELKARAKKRRPD
jgi:tetratricopeptide (TPR) repeat protein